MIIVRRATIGDAEDILKIYSYYIETTSVTFEHEVPTLKEFKERMRGIMMEYPYIVVEEQGKVIGFGYSGKQRERDAYQWNVELSVYADKDVHGKGVGKRIYNALIELSRLQGIQNLYGVVTKPNEKSEALHASMGFEEIGVYPNAGFESGRWKDVVWYLKSIGDFNGEPDPVIPFPDLKEAEVDEILKRQSSM